MMNINNYLKSILQQLGLNDAQQQWIIVLILLLGLVLLYLILQFLANLLLHKTFSRVAQKTKNKFDDYLVQNQSLNILAKIIPLVICIQLIPAIFKEYTSLITPIQKGVDMVFVVLIIFFIRSVVKAVRNQLGTLERFKDKPLDSYVQVISILLYFIGIVIIFTQLTGKNTLTFLGTLGAASAILMLIFKDTILGFVSSIQVSTNDTVRIGDWVEFAKYGADGMVTEINLNTVKIKNWDNTVTSIPTYFLTTDAFRNMRYMQASGGRRIKRSIFIKISSIRYLSEEEINSLRKIQLLKDYIEERQKEIAEYNAQTHADKSMPVNGRNITNVGMFRAYANRYIKTHKGAHQNMTMMVRHLQPTDKGLPMEIYLFTNNTQWVYFEEIMADIFDHLLAAIPYFYLEVYESPASSDFKKGANVLSEML